MRATIKQAFTGKALAQVKQGINLSNLAPKAVSQLTAQEQVQEPAQENISSTTQAEDINGNRRSR